MFLINMAVLSPETSLSKIKRYFRSNLSVIFYLYHKIKKSKKIFSRENLFVDSYYKNILKPLDKIFLQSGTELTELETQIDKNIPSVSGWIPYIKNRTSVVLYNFFSVNYSIRKNVILRISIVKNLSIVFQKTYQFPTYGIKEFKINDFTSVDANSIIVEIFHPSIKKNHGSHDGHLRFWGKYYDKDENYISTVHSMPFPKNVNYARRQAYLRTYKHSFDDTNQITVSPSEHNNFDNYKESKKFFYGYNVLLDKDKNPRSIWHYAPERNDLIDVSEASISYQGFWSPYHKNLNTMIVFDNEELGILGNQTVELFLIFKDQIIEAKKIEVNKFYKNHINKIFDYNIDRDFTIIAKLHRNKIGFFHIHFDTFHLPGDQNHSDVLNCEIIDKKLTYPRLNKKGNSRKFFHIHKGKDNNLSKNYLIVNLHPTINNSNPDLKIRVLTDTSAEFIFNYKLSTNQPVFSFDINKLFPQLFESMKNNAIVQVESIDDNFMGSFIHFNTSKQFICVDHLTGG